MHRHLLLLLAPLLVAYTPGVLAVDSCAPDCTGMNAGDWVEDPMNCNQFYVCLQTNQPSELPMQCPPHNPVFDPVTGTCITGDECLPSCVPSYCHLTCNETLDMISDPRNCSVYYMCLLAGTTSEALSCPGDRPYFDGEYCVSDSSKCCSNLCTPYCHAGVVQVVDPKDCTKYYVCLAEGPVEESLHFACAPGENFDLAAGQCMAGVPCVTLCEDVTTTTPAPTTTTPYPTTTTPYPTTTTTTPAPTTTTPYPTTTTPAPTTTTPRPTTTTTPRPTTTTSMSGGCMPSFTCPGVGLYPMCFTCQPYFFQCLGVGQNGIPQECDGGLVFNTNPDYPYCVAPSHCPYYPPS